MRPSVAFHDDLAPIWEGKYSRRSFSERADVLLSFLDEHDLSGSRWLDAGCGSGRLTRMLAARGCEVIGVDASPAMVRVAAELGRTTVGGQSQTEFRGTHGRLLLRVLDLEANGWMMKQIIQSYRSGEISVAEVPRPALRPGGLVVRNICSLISAGTERQGVELARKSLLGKARARPDLVGKVLDKARRDGVATAVRAAVSRLDKWLPLGYSCAGEVLEVGRGAEEFQVGDLVACAGARYAAHAELVFVPKNLAARAPEGLSPEEAAFATLGSIAMQGLRQAQVTVGERVAVIGLGLIGQLTCQLVSAACGTGFQPVAPITGWKPVPLDALSRDDPLLARWAEQCTGGIGFDSVIIAAGTASSDPVELAGEIARDRATVVAVGAVGMTIPRRTYYRKEITFKLSRSYGPGRYDPTYEEKGIDYPVGYARWTERRNMEAFLALAAAGKINVRGLITHQFRIEEAVRAYEVVTAEGDELHLGMLLHYDQGDEGGGSRVDGSDVAARSSAALPRPSSLAPPASPHVRVGLIGAGRFARGVLLPALTRTKQCVLRGVASAGGLSARQAQDKHGFAYCTSDAHDVLSDSESDAVAIATPHPAIRRRRGPRCTGAAARSAPSG